MKLATSCQQCRSSKRKCTPTSGPYKPCTECQQRRLICSKTKRPSNHGPRRLRSLVQEDDSIDLLTPDTMARFIDLYMRYIHDRPQSLFHEKTLWKDFRSGAMSKSLLYALCATGCRFSGDLHHRDLDSKLRQRSRSLFSQDLETISLSNVHTCILLANLYAAQQDNGLEALYFGIANRMAHVLRLHEDNFQDSPIIREIKCRTWWTLYIADRWCPPALNLPQEISNYSPSLKFPMDEVAFQNLESTTDQHDNSFASDGLWKFMITLVDFLGPIHSLNQSLVRDSSDRHETEQQVASLAARLQTWIDTLPEHMMMNDHNLDIYRQSGHGGTLVALHLGYHHYCTLLFFQYLDTATELTVETTLYANRCRYHALRYSELLHTARQKGDCHVVYLTVAFMTMVASSVLLHTLLFGEDEEIATARVYLTHNFEALVELRRYWPHMDKITRRLLIFQNACLRSTNTNTHKINRWMVRFLLEHSLPLGEKVDEEASMSLSISLTPNHEVPVERTDMVSEAFADLCR